MTDVMVVMSMVMMVCLVLMALCTLTLCHICQARKVGLRRGSLCKGNCESRMDRSNSRTPSSSAV